MPLEYPTQEYFPGAKIRLIIRFDEFGQVTRLKPAPGKTTKNLNGIRDPRGDLQVIKDPNAPTGITRYLLVEQGATQAQVATAQARSSDGLTYDVTAIPADMTWDQNGIRTADTLQVTLKYIDIPIDPRCVRSCAIEAYVGCSTAEEYFQGIQGGVRGGIAAQGQGSPLNLIPDTWLDQARKQRSNLRFQGWVDKWTVEWGDNAEPRIMLDCRDNTQILIDQQVSPRLVLGAADPNDPIDKAIAVYLSHYPQMQGLTVQYLPTTDNPPVLRNLLANTAYRPNLGPQPSKGGGATDKLSTWDYLTDVCGSIGHIVRVQGTTVIVQRPRSVTTSTPTIRADDPFQGRTLATGQTLTYRRFVYGRNVKSMRIVRNFAKNHPTNIEVRSYNTENKTLLVARFPLPEDRKNSPLQYAIPGDAQTDQKWLVVRIAGVTDQKTLRFVAQTYYEQLGRNEIQVEVKTHNLASFGGGNLDPDILDMLVGDTFELLVNRSDDEPATISRIEQALTIQSKNAAFMQALGFASDFSTAYAKAYTDAGFLPQWRLKQMKVTWNVETGVELSLTGVNYIEVRADKSLATGEEPDTTSPQASNAPQSVNKAQIGSPVPNNLAPLPEPAPGEVASTGVSSPPPLTSS